MTNSMMMKKKKLKEKETVICLRNILISSVGIVAAICVAAVLAAVIYYALLLKSLGTSPTDELKRCERTINGTTGWDLNQCKGYPLLMDGWNPTWSNRTIRTSGTLGDTTWRFDATCSESVVRQARSRGLDIRDVVPRAIPCEGNSSLRCVRMPFHLHLHGEYAENRYSSDGSTLSYRGMFHMYFFANFVSTVAVNKPVAAGAARVSVDYSGTPRVLNFTDPPEIPKNATKMNDMAGSCPDANHLIPEWGQEASGYDIPKKMNRPLNVLLYLPNNGSTYVRTYFCTCRRN